MNDKSQNQKHKWTRSEIALYQDCSNAGELKTVLKEEDICLQCSNGHVCTIAIFKSAIMGDAAIVVRRCLKFSY